MNIETRSIWSCGAGQYQVWHTIRVEDHKIPGISDLTTPSFYHDQEKPPMRRRKYFAHDMQTGEHLWYWVTPAGKITPA